METRYYSESGRPGAQHKLALHTSKTVFDRITGHLDRKERLRLEMEKEAGLKKYLHEGTQAMTANWDNSVYNLRKKKEEARQHRLAQKADDRVEQYFEVLKCQADERAKYNEEVARSIFITRGAQKEFNSSFLFSECLYANAKHIELKKKEKEKERRDWEDYEKQIIAEDATFNDKTLLMECKRRTEAKKNQEFIKKQIAERQKLKDEAEKLKLDEEKIDIIKQYKEIEEIKKNADEDYIKAKSYCIETLKNSREIAKRRHLASEKTNNEMEIVCDMFRDAKSKMDCTRQLMKKKDIEKTLKKQEIACEKLMEIYSRKQDNEDQIMAKAVAEQIAAEDLMKQKRKAYDEGLLKERKKNYENALEEETKRKEKEREIQKWEMLNRIKLAEIARNEEIERKEKQKRKMKEFAEILDEQVEENKSIRAEKKAKEDAFKWNDFAEKDEKFLEYGEEILAKQKAAGKCTFPIERAIMVYKEYYGLVPKKLKKPFACTEEENNSKVKLPAINRRICPTKNDSSSCGIGIHDQLGVAKGVKKGIVRSEINFEDYVVCLETFKEKHITQTMIRAEKHKVYTICQNKLALSPYDDKRYLIPGSYETLPWGHYSIDQPMDEDVIIG